jgi:hypothetical protein
MRYKVDGKYVEKKDIPKNAVLDMVIHEKHYETPEYSKQQAVNASRFFQKMNEDNEELKRRHG